VLEISTGTGVIALPLAHHLDGDNVLSVRYLDADHVPGRVLYHGCDGLPVAVPYLESGSRELAAQRTSVPQRSPIDRCHHHPDCSGQMSDGTLTTGNGARTSSPPTRYASRIGVELAVVDQRPVRRRTAVAVYAAASAAVAASSPNPTE
jgi:hypothetical protein